MAVGAGLGRRGPDESADAVPPRNTEALRQERLERRTDLADHRGGGEREHEEQGRGDDEGGMLGLHETLLVGR